MTEAVDWRVGGSESSGKVGTVCEAAKAARSHESGVTIVELVVVVAIGVLILSAGLVVQMESTATYESSLGETVLTGSLRAALREVVGTLQGASPGSIQITAGVAPEGDRLSFQVPVGFDVGTGAVIWGASGVAGATIEYSSAGSLLVREVKDSAGNVIVSQEVFRYLGSDQGGKPLAVVANNGIYTITLQAARSVGGRTLRRTLTTSTAVGP